MFGQFGKLASPISGLNWEIWAQNGPKFRRRWAANRGPVLDLGKFGPKLGPKFHWTGPLSRPSVPFWKFGPKIGPKFQWLWAADRGPEVKLRLIWAKFGPNFGSFGANFFGRKTGRGEVGGWGSKHVRNGLDLGFWAQKGRTGRKGARWGGGFFDPLGPKKLGG